jgi:hypothetical protein
MGTALPLARRVAEYQLPWLYISMVGRIAHSSGIAFRPYRRLSHLTAALCRSLQTGETKNRQGRAVPILQGDMQGLLLAANGERDANWPDCQFVFSREGNPIKDFCAGWRNACIVAGVPELNFHDLRRTAVRNNATGRNPAGGAGEDSAPQNRQHGASVSYRRCRGLERSESAARKSDEGIRYCNPDCNQRGKDGETGRYTQTREISRIGRHDTRPYRQNWFQVEVSFKLICGCGGIGRRAWFRSMWPQGCGGSSPSIRTSYFIGELLLESQENCS